MEIRELTCINCPMGCGLRVTLQEGEILSVTGNTCPRGAVYARSEVLHPVRMLTTSLPVTGGRLAMVSCKTSRPVDKDSLFRILQVLREVQVQAPVQIGDVLLADAAGSGADIVATRQVERVDSHPSI